MSEFEEVPIMTPEQVQGFVEEQSYPVQNGVMSRCIDGRYPSDESLPALAIPGADMGQVVMIFDVLNQIKKQNIHVDPENVFNALIEVVGGVENIRFHTDSHGKEKGVGAGCGYFARVKEDPSHFGVTPEQVVLIEEKFSDFLKNGATEVELQGEHEEKGALIINGYKGVYPRGNFFIFQKTLVEQRNRKIADTLFKRRQIVAHGFLGKLNEVSQVHLLKIKTLLTKDKPIPTFNVLLSNDGQSEVHEIKN